MHYSDELYHHGVKGQKWGVRRYQNEDGSLTPAGRKRMDKQIKKVNSMYDHSNKWTDRKITKLEKKGKTAKANVMKYMRDENERARKEKVNALNKMNYTDLKKAKKQDNLDFWFGGQNWMKNNESTMTTTLSRINEYSRQRGMRWTSNFTLNSTLARMTPKEGYEYLRRKFDQMYSYEQGYYSHSDIDGEEL